MSRPGRSRHPGWRVCARIIKIARLGIDDDTLEQPRANWISVLEDCGVPTGAIQNVAEAVDDPQNHARNMVVEVPRWCDGHHRVPGNPIKMGGCLDWQEAGNAP